MIKIQVEGELAVTVDMIVLVMFRIYLKSNFVWRLVFLVFRCKTKIRVGSLLIHLCFFSTGCLNTISIFSTNFKVFWCFINYLIPKCLTNWVTTIFCWNTEEEPLLVTKIFCMLTHCWTPIESKTKRTGPVREPIMCQLVKYNSFPKLVFIWFNWVVCRHSFCFYFSFSIFISHINTIFISHINTIFRHISTRIRDKSAQHFLLILMSIILLQWYSRNKLTLYLPGQWVFCRIAKTLPIVLPRYLLISLLDDGVFQYCAYLKLFSCM